MGRRRSGLRDFNRNSQFQKLTEIDPKWQWTRGTHRSIREHKGEHQGEQFFEVDFSSENKNGGVVLIGYRVQDTGSSKIQAGHPISKIDRDPEFKARAGRLIGCLKVHYLMHREGVAGASCMSCGKCVREVAPKR